MPSIKVTSEELHTVAGQLNSGASATTSQFVTLKGHVDKLLSEGWVSPSSRQFQEAYSQWQAAANQMVEALHSISSSMNVSATNYEQAESTNTNNFR